MQLYQAQTKPAYNYRYTQVLSTMVPVAGLEPARLAALDFESTTSTNSITPAGAKE